MPWALPQYEECPHCGAQVVQACAASHRCDPKRKLEHEYKNAHPEDFDDELGRYLVSREGKFAAWYAARRR